MSQGGGHIRTQLNVLSIITEGDETQNIRLFDGDVVNVSKSPIVLRDQLRQAGKTNLTPRFIQVYMSGRIEQSGSVTLPQGSSLVQAIDLAGGPKFLHGKVEFIRFTSEGEIDRRKFKFKNDAPLGDYRNPLLMAGDIIRFQETIMTKSLGVTMRSHTCCGHLPIYALFNGFND